jgi:hypothetical protein
VTLRKWRRDDHGSGIIGGKVVFGEALNLLHFFAPWLGFIFNESPMEHIFRTLIRVVGEENPMYCRGNVSLKSMALVLSAKLNVRDDDISAAFN